MENEYRSLTRDEIQELAGNGCSSETWELVRVKPAFRTVYVRQTVFSGHVRLGVFDESFAMEGGVSKHSGIFRAYIHNCTIGDNCLIDNIKGYIANYDIGENSCIEDCNTIVCEGETTFGNGVKAAVLDETGGREVIIFDRLSSHLAYILALYKYRPKLTASLEKVIAAYCDGVKQERGTIGQNVYIKNVSYIKNVKIGDNCHIEDSARLENGSINSNLDAPVYVGSEVTATDFIVCSEAHIDEGVSLTRCFVGQACRIGKRFSATDSLFFSNCHLENGEACSVFAGPYTVSHHKSTLLIGGMFSFYNAGSGTNQSNHMYKLGPIHYGILERGTKSASNSYMMHPSHVGAYSVIIGQHYAHFDTPLLPFSYLMVKDGRTHILPGINLQTAGTARDIRKWEQRDGRTDTDKLDCIHFDFLNPCIVSKLIGGIVLLEKIQEKQGLHTETYTYQNCLITNKDLRRGVRLYKLILDKYFGGILTRLLENEEDMLPQTIFGNNGGWIDMAGLVAPKPEVDKIMEDIVQGRLETVADINRAFFTLHQRFAEFEWNWAYKTMADLYNLRANNLPTTFRFILDNWKTACEELDTMILNDARKEFEGDMTIGFGIDGSAADKEADLEAVRGRFEDNPFVQELQENKAGYQETYERLIQLI